MYTISLLATLNARESLRLQIELFGQASLPRITRTSNSVSRRSMRAVIDAMARPAQFSVIRLVTNIETALSLLQYPSKEIVVAIQRDTRVTFEERSEDDMQEARRRGPYPYQSQSPTEPCSPLISFQSDASPQKQDVFFGTSSSSDSQLASSSSSSPSPGFDSRVYRERQLSV